MNPANTPPVISRGNHEPFAHYLDRLDTRLTWGRHEVRTPGKRFASRLGWTEGEMETVFGPAKIVYRGGPRDKYDETMIPPIELEESIDSWLDRIQTFLPQGEVFIHVGSGSEARIRRYENMEGKVLLADEDGYYGGPTKEDFTMASFFAAATTTSSKDDTPDWAYDEDDYCVCCGNGKWKYHMPECKLRDALDK